MPLSAHVAKGADADALLAGILAWAREGGLTLYAAQEEAILELLEGKHVILATPTGSGKSLVALALHAKAIAGGERSFYTAPIKALVGEKFFALCRELGPERVGLMTGDATVNRDAPIVCCTAEILASIALREGDGAGIDSVVMDEFHYYGDRDRGTAWQIPLLTMKRAQLLLMSATLGDVSFFERELRERTGRDVATIRTMQRPVPLEFEYRETPLHETLADLCAKGRAPVYVVHFTQRGAAELAQDLTSVELVTKERKGEIKDAIASMRWDSPYGKELQRFVRHGVGVHHAGLLPKYRLLVEKLAQRGLLAVICGTDTLGVGVNVPIRSVLFTQLCKFDGQKTALLSVRDFQQIAGRAGRKGFDDRGWVVAQAPEHAIENKVAREKAEGDPKKQKKLVAKKPPERGYAHWDGATFERLWAGEPEKLESRFRVSHGLVLSVLEGANDRGENACRALSGLIRSSHESRNRKLAHGRHAIALLRSLRDANVIEIERGRGIRVRSELQEDFSLNQTLSLFVVDALPKLGREDPAYALDVLSVVESVLEDPEVVLIKQLDKLKDDKMAELKAQRVEYDERIAELDEIDVPRPKAELLEAAFDDFVKRHPWAPKDGLRPKSVARDMWERGATFGEYVKEYGLARSEGVLLRYLSDAYKALVQNVPEAAKTDEVYDLSDWLRAIVKQVDSSLLDEWESMRSGASAKVVEPAPRAEPDLTTDRRAFTVLVRNAAFRVVRALSRRSFGEAASLAGEAWTAAKVEAAMVDFEVEHGSPRTDPEARSPKHLRVHEDRDAWRIEQVLLAEDGPTDWTIQAKIDLARAREAGEVVLEVLGVGRAVA
jgi:superfamily II RNA helicase